MKKYLDYILLGASALFGVLTLILMVAPGVTSTILGTTVTSSVYKVMGEGGNDGGAVVGLVFALIFTILALVVPACLCVFNFLGKKFGFEAIVAAAAAVLALVAGILFFCTKAMSVGSSDYIHLGAGAVLCGIFMILNALVLCYYGFTKFKK
ncbi:MAG: hypothetical protein IJR61_04820 [Clostridia bacterium]|nr:hypothetical protein [Clostridia bacterium]